MKRRLIAWALAACAISAACGVTALLAQNAPRPAEPAAPEPLRLRRDVTGE